MRNALLKITFFVIICAICINCSSSEDEQIQSNSRNIKYEITGNYSGQLTVVYNDNVSGNTVITVTSLPWNKEITYDNNVQVIGVSASSVVGNYGSANQSATLKIYSGGVVVKSATASTDINGLINFSPLTFGF